MGRVLLAPALGMMQAAPGFQASVLDQVQLLGSERYFDGKVVSSKDTVVGWRFKGDDPNPLRVPVGIDVNEREMPPPASR